MQEKNILHSIRTIPREQAMRTSKNPLKILDYIYIMTEGM